MPIRKRDIAVVCLCVIILAISITISSIAIERHNNREIALSYAPIEHLQVRFEQPTSTNLNTETFGTNTAFSSGVTYTASTSNLNEVRITADAVNAELYSYCDTYFNAFYGYTKLSPILPMAIANVETPGRADFNVTWSALFPSKIVPVSEISTFDVTSVVSNPNYYAALSKEYSTRDRGCLQMSPTYGTSNKELNKQMSGTEKDKLRTIDTSTYSTWVSGASDSPGDRFYLPDVLLRMSAAMQQQCNNMSKNEYPPNNDFQLIAMCAMGHQSSGIWGTGNHSKSIGCWKSGEKAYEWASLVGSQELVDKLTDYAISSPATYIDSKTAKTLFAEVYDVTYSDYATKDTVCYYPVKALYSYIKLCMLYTS